MAWPEMAACAMNTMITVLCSQCQLLSSLPRSSPDHKRATVKSDFQLKHFIHEYNVTDFRDHLRQVFF